MKVHVLNIPAYADWEVRLFTVTCQPNSIYDPGGCYHLLAEILNLGVSLVSEIKSEKRFTRR